MNEPSGSDPFASLQNASFLRACLRQPTPHTPVWLMRQAGRYLPEYRATRASAGSFLAMAKNPELACEVTLQPLRRFPLDAAILFSDILTVPDAMGLGLSFAEGEGPKFATPVPTGSRSGQLVKCVNPTVDWSVRPKPRKRVWGPVAPSMEADIMMTPGFTARMSSYERPTEVMKSGRKLSTTMSDFAMSARARARAFGCFRFRVMARLSRLQLPK